MLPWLVVLGLVVALILLAVGGGVVIAVLGLLVWWLAFPLALAAYARTRSARQRKFASTQEP